MGPNVDAAPHVELQELIRDWQRMQHNRRLLMPPATGQEPQLVTLEQVAELPAEQVRDITDDYLKRTLNALQHSPLVESRSRSPAVTLTPSPQPSGVYEDLPEPALSLERRECRAQLYVPYSFDGCLSCG